MKELNEFRRAFAAYSKDVVYKDEAVFRMETSYRTW